METGDLARMEKSFNHVCNLKIKSLLTLNQTWFQNRVATNPEDSASANLQKVLDSIEANQLPPLYVIIDEYDNFANQLIVSHKDRLYQQLMADEGFLKTFFKILKEGRKTAAIQNVFITSVLPVTIDELASGFNIATFITLDRDFENMLGFTQTEVDRLLDEIYRDYQIDPGTRKQVQTVIKNQYNGYHFIRPNGDALYNSTILIYFLNGFTRYKEIPKHLTDLNLKTDIFWIKRLTGANPRYTEEFVDQLTLHNFIPYDEVFLVEKFNMSQFFEKGFFPISFYYLGVLTK